MTVHLHLHQKQGNTNSSANRVPRLQLLDKPTLYITITFYQAQSAL